jgi:hypothetical protein
MGIARIRIEPVENAKVDRYLSKDFKRNAKKYKKLAIFLTILLTASISLNIYQYYY